MKKNHTHHRYLLIDSIRGFAAANMVLFHFLYDIFIIYGKNPDWYGLPCIHIWQQAICRTFICTAGFSWHFSQKHNLRRGLFFLLCGALISLFVWIFLPAQAIWFGILTFMGLAVLLAVVLHRFLKQIPPAFGAAASYACFVLFFDVPHGFLGIGPKKLLLLPACLYQIKILTSFGFPFPGFTSSDYFPLVPWIFLFLTGYYAYLLFQNSTFFKRAARISIPVLSAVGRNSTFFKHAARISISVLSAIGRNSIWIYLLHQPACMLACAVFAAG